MLTQNSNPTTPPTPVPQANSYPPTLAQPAGTPTPTQPAPAPVTITPAKRKPEAWLVPSLLIFFGLMIIFAIAIFLLRFTSPEKFPLDNPSPVTSEPSATTSSAVRRDPNQLDSTPRGQIAAPGDSTTDATPGALVTTSVESSSTSITTLGPGAIIFGDYLFTIFDRQLIKIPLSCPSSCPHQLSLNLQTYTTIGQTTPQTVNIPLQQGRVAGEGQITIYETDTHERLIADLLFTLRQPAASQDVTYRNSYNFGTLTNGGLYLFVDNGTTFDHDDNPLETLSVYLLVAPNSAPALLKDDFGLSAAYLGELFDQEKMEIIYESNLRSDLGFYTHNVYAYFPNQNVIQTIFTNLVLLGISPTGQLVVYYPRTDISSPQVGLISINAQLHGLRGNQILIPPEKMPISDPPDYADGVFYFVTPRNQIYISTLESPTPVQIHDFTKYYQEKGFTLTNWWYARSNNNHPGICVCSEDQVKKDGTGSFYDYQLKKFIESTSDCYGRRSVGTWYCA